MEKEKIRLYNKEELIDTIINGKRVEVPQRFCKQEKEFNLSEKRINWVDKTNSKYNTYPESDIKEFIRLLKELIKDNFSFDELEGKKLFRKIDKLAGKELTNGI